MHGVTIVKLALLVAMDISRSVKASHFLDIGNLGRASGKQRNFVSIRQDVTHALT